MKTDQAVSLAPLDHSKSEIEFTEGLPQTLVSVLERRYLSDFQPSDWRIEPRPGDHARPLLREIVALGRPSQPGLFAQAMPHVLAACHEPGHSLVMILNGTGSRHRLYVGGRRMIGAGARCSEDYFALQEGAFRSHLNGLEFAKLQSLGPEEMPELAAFLRDAPATRVITGIPSRRPQDSGGFQSLDRIVAGIGEQRYAMMVVADPLESAAIDGALDVCRRLRGEVHSYIRHTVSRGKGGSESETHTDSQETAVKGNWKESLPLCLSSLVAFSSVVALAGVNAFPLTQALGATMNVANMMNRPDTTGKASQLQSGKNWSESGQVELLDAHAEACQQLLQQHIDRLMKARGGGWWRTAIYIVAESDAGAHSVAGGLRSLAGGEGSALDPLRVLSLPDYLVREAMERGQILRMRPLSADREHPLGASFDALATCLDSEELSVLLTPPQREIPGLPMRDHGEFAMSTPAPTPDSIAVGRLLDEMGRDLDAVTVSAGSLNRHVFVSGMTGSGKTNTCMGILLESYGKLKIPFLVLEPAKSEYRRLLQTPELKGKLGVYSIGEGSSLPLRINPLAPVAGMPLGRHIDMLKAVFNASFAMYAGMPQALEEALIEVYKERGWNIYTSQNVYLDGRASLDDVSALMPTLGDVHDKIDGVLKKKGYAEEIRNNMGAALRSRLAGLMAGQKGLALNSRRSTPLAALFGRPAVVELQDLGDDEEKAFVMAVLFVMLCQYAEARQRDLPEEQKERLQHLTLVEEAHRLLETPRGAASAEVGDPRRKAVSMFTNMLAEMRAYGEGFLIADQIPSKLAPEILKNSNLKIAHQLPDPEERSAVGSCMNLNEAQMRQLNSLKTGWAAVHDESIGAAVLVRMYPVKTTRAPNLSERAARELAQLGETGDKAHLYRHAGCCSCASPCDFFPAVEGVRGADEGKGQMALFLDSLLLGEAVAAWSGWTAWREGLRAMAGLRLDADRGIEYCAAAQATHDWLAALLVDRRGGAHGPNLRPTERLLQESAARSIGPLLAGWLRTPSLNEAAREAFMETHRRLAAVVAAAPPRELPGCSQCPARCRMLSFVAPHLTKLGQKVASKLSQIPVEIALKGVAEVCEEPMNSSAALAHPDSSTSRRAWLYCLVANLKDRDAQREKLLALLREPARDIPGGV